MSDAKNVPQCSADTTSEPVAWQVLSESGAVRLWAQTKDVAETYASARDLKCIPLYAAPVIPAPAQAPFKRSEVLSKIHGIFLDHSPCIAEDVPLDGFIDALVLAFSSVRRGNCQCCGELADLSCGSSRFGSETWACADCWGATTSPVSSTHRPGPMEGAGLTPAPDRKDQGLVEEGGSIPPLAATPCAHAAIISLDGKWHCQKCGDAVEMSSAQSSTDHSSEACAKCQNTGWCHGQGWCQNSGIALSATNCGSGK